MGGLEAPGGGGGGWISCSGSNGVGEGGDLNISGYVLRPLTSSTLERTL